MNEELMTRGDRQELAKLARLRERVAKADASRRAAELKADFEQQIAAIYSFDDDDVWRASRAAVSEETDRANAAITQRCRELGIPDEFAPSVASGWISRGQNAAKGRRDELRRVAYTRIDQLEKDAKHEIARRSLEVQTELVAAGLTTTDARTFLETMPTAEQLMPPVSAADFEQAIPGRVQPRAIGP